MNKKIVKTAVILHGITASGKSSFAQALIAYLDKRNIKGKSFSTDDFFITPEGRYIFDVSKLSEYHARNIDNFTNAMKDDVPIVICDNTNLMPWQSEAYTNGAREQGYDVLFVDFKPRDIVEHVKAQEVTETRPGAHGIEKKIVERLLCDYYQYSDLLYKDTAIDKERHVTYIWDNKKKQRVISSEPSKYFDLDFLVVLEPDDLNESLEHFLNEVSSYIVKEKV